MLVIIFFKLKFEVRTYLCKNDDSKIITTHIKISKKYFF
jgi:hypothetical protein